MTTDGDGASSMSTCRLVGRRYGSDRLGKRLVSSTRSRCTPAPTASTGCTAPSTPDEEPALLAELFGIVLTSE